MKPFVATWNLGDRVRGRVTEQLPGGDLIISFKGDLLRVSNETKKTFSAGEDVILEVASLQPIRFKLALNKKAANKTPGRFDVSI